MLDLPDLESLTATLDAGVVRVLGDTITYTPDGEPPRTLKAFVDHSDERRSLGGSGVVTGDLSVEIRKADVAVIGKADTIYLPQTDTAYLPKGTGTDESGRFWIVSLKVKPQ